MSAVAITTSARRAGAWTHRCLLLPMIDGHVLQCLAACISHILLLKLLLMRQGVSHLGWEIMSVCVSLSCIYPKDVNISIYFWDFGLL